MLWSQWLKIDGWRPQGLKRVYGISRIALRGVLQKPLRSFLTMLTAAIGISSVVATIAIINGANAVLETSVADLGTNIVVMQNGQGFQSQIRKSSQAEEFLKKIPGVRNLLKKQPISERDVSNLRNLFAGMDVLVSPAIIQSVNSVSDLKQEEIRATLVATDAVYFDMLAIGPIEGRLMTRKEIREEARVCVLDEAAAYKLISSELEPVEMVGKTLTLSTKDESFDVKIVGILRDPYSLRLKGNRKLDVGAAARSVFYSRLEYKNVYIPISLFEGSDGTQANTIFVTPSRTEDVESVKARMEQYVSERGKDATVWDQKKWIVSTTGIIEELTAVNHSIWVMILCVAMIMIITITLVSVRERYYEIAVRITEGATKSKVILQFSLESLYQSVAGGVVGIALGLLMIDLCERYIIRWPAPASPRVLVFAILISIGIGLLTSIPTARRAASLNPVDVLRMH